MNLYKFFIGRAVGFLVVLSLLTGGYFLTHSKKQNTDLSENKLIASVSYSCRGGKSIDAKYYEGKPIPTKSNERPIPTGMIRLKFGDGAEMRLFQTISADGTRYANTDESFVFWGKGNGAMILENDMEKNYIGCIEIVSKPAGSNLSQIYTEPDGNFSLRFPVGYTVDSTYQNQLDLNKSISVVKFSIPAEISKGTNLSRDSFVSVESLPKTENCTANLFLSDMSKAVDLTEDEITYSVASSTGAGAGNRYEETIYAFPGTNPCVVIRYFIHYMVFENYPEGTVKRFDKVSLVNEFNKIRKTLILR